MAKFLIIRFSAIGDVAMTVPVVDSLARRYVGDSFIFVSQAFLSPLFEHCPDNLQFIAVDLKKDYKGTAGMYRLFRELKPHRFDAVADLHDVLRTKLLRFLFRITGIRVEYIDKGRKEKRQLIDRKNKTFRQLKSVIERYADVFKLLGKPVDVNFRSIFEHCRGDFGKIEAFTGLKTEHWLGIAPFAKHQGKMYPKEKIESVLAYFSRKEAYRIFLFGGGENEKAILKEWSEKYPGTKSVAGILKLSDELLLMSRLDVMLSMDSANMHLASLTATPVVSVWGATHPFAGFYGYNQAAENAVQIDLPCRPCSVYGNKPCFRKDNACMAGITPEMMIEKIEKMLTD
jgi:ADP-heptose:LPS heptosyltransferase